MASAEKKGGLSAIVVVIVVTLIGLGAGSAFGGIVASLNVPPSSHAGGHTAAKTSHADCAPSHKAAPDKHGKSHKPKAGHGAAPCKSTARPGERVVVALPPIITNLAAPASRWIRVELSVVLANGVASFDDVARRKIAQDILGRLRLMKLAEIEGREGLLNLRSDLFDLVHTRGKKDVDEIIINGMIVE